MALMRKPSNTQLQRKRLIEYLQEFGRITTFEARSILDIPSPASRIFELKERDFNITTNKLSINGHKGVAQYVLLPTI